MTPCCFRANFSKAAGFLFTENNIMLTNVPAEDTESTEEVKNISDL